MICNKILKLAWSTFLAKTTAIGILKTILPDLKKPKINMMFVTFKSVSLYTPRNRRFSSTQCMKVKITDGSRILHTLLVKHYNDLLDRQSSERGKDEVTYFYVGDVFCIHLGTKYADFQEKIFAEISGKKLQTLGIT